MMRRCLFLLGLTLTIICINPTKAAAIDHEQQIGSASGCTAAGLNGADWDTIAQCQGGGTWARSPYFVGTTSDSCSSSSYAGMTRFYGGTLQYCDGTAWQTLQSYTGSTGYLVMTANTYNGCFGQTISAMTNPSGTTALITTSAAHDLSTGMTVIVAGATPSAYNGTFTITSVPTTKSFTYTMSSSPGNATALGTFCTAGGESVADQICYNDLTTNQSWKYYSAASANGQLITSKVHAWIGGVDRGNRLWPNTTYYFANAGNSSGGYSYSTDNFGYLLVLDGQSWATSTTFGTSAGYIWAGQGVGSSTYNGAITFPAATSNNCSGWTVGTSGSTGYILKPASTGTGKVSYAGCQSTYALACFVNP